MDETIIKPKIKPQAGVAQGDDRTVIKPRPAGNPIEQHDRTVITPRRKPVAGTAFLPSDSQTNSSASHNSNSAKYLPRLLPAHNLGLPELIASASPLLSIISQLRQLDGTIDIKELRLRIANMVKDFISDSQKEHSKDIVSKSSYALCATIDEAVLNTPWGESSEWSQKPLLSIFHKETYGGEKFYSMLDEEVTTDAKRFDLIELLYLCLSLGFLGKLRIDKHGQVKAEQIRANTYSLLKKNRDRFEGALSSSISPITTAKNKLYSFLPVWLLAASLALAGFGIYNYWLIELNKQSDIVIAELANLIPIREEEKLPDGQVRKEIIFLRELLAQEIKRDILSVDDYHSYSTVVLHSNSFFGSGSGQINEALFPILDKISKALESIPGRIIVSGHTDNIAIRTTRYPSNWHLSLARASAVGKYMSASADLKARLLPEGRADSEPVADNSTSEGRAKNRRVTIELYYTDQPLPLLQQ